MTEPLKLLLSLDEISTSHTVFEKDQVLTEGQLNDLARYFDDQDRLTRVNLLGVGIACGLEVALRGGQVVVGKGTGITTDGDLLRLPAELAFDRFKPYSRTAPAYRPFYQDGDVTKEMLPVFELVPVGAQDPRAHALGELNGFYAMVAVLLMESHVHDPDLCTVTGCDNEGRAAIHTPRVLLVGADVLAAFAALPALAPAAPRLDEVVAARALLPPGTATAAQIEAAYRTACQKTLAALTPALNGFYAAAAGLLGDLLPADSGPGWVARLQDLATSQPAFGIQYFYDFLLDVVETWNALRELVPEATAVCCPNVDAFPKHLLLGRLLRPADQRTGFYPSLPVSGDAGRLAHLRFLAAKLGALIELFERPTGPGTLRITPGRREDRSLEERAIPFYYKLPIQHRWNHDLERRGEAGRNVSYLAADAAYGAQGAAKAPLDAPLRGCDFFRIEGHQGQDVKTALADLEGQIGQKNLPFRVRAVLLDADLKKIAVKPAVRWSDLHRFHSLVRKDLVRQLGDAKRFSGTFITRMNDAMARNVITDRSERADGASLKALAGQNATALRTQADIAIGQLDRPYLQYREELDWTAPVTAALTAAGTFKVDLGNVVKTDLATPFDTLVAGNQPLWLGWLDQALESKDQKEDEKLLFARFLAQHPGIEHCGGVVRGGTFVLVYNAGHKVVADFMLDYACCDTAEEEIDEPALPVVIEPPVVVDEGLTFQPWRERLVREQVAGAEGRFDGKINETQARFDGKIDTTWTQLNNRIAVAQDHFDGRIDGTWQLFNGRILATQDHFSGRIDETQDRLTDKYTETQNGFFKLVRDSITLGRDASDGSPDGGQVPGPGRPGDVFLDLQLHGFRIRLDRLDVLREEILKPDLDPQRRTFLETQLRDTEVEIAKAASDTSQYVVDSKLDVKSGSDGFKAMAAVSNAVSRLSHKDALAQVEKGLGGVRDRAGRQTGSEMVKGLLIALLKSKGFPG